MTIQKAVIPVAGLGTRLLPTTKAMPKEMLPAGRLPIIHHVVDELIGAGICRFLFVSNRSKVAIENHFDDYSELMLHLELDGSDMKEASRFDYRKRGVEFYFTRQQVPLGQTKPLGTGDAVAVSESFVGGDDFVVAFGDSIIQSTESPPLLRRMVESHVAHRSGCTIGVAEVSPEDVRLYGVVAPDPAAGDAEDLPLVDIVEKPDADAAPSRLAVSARYVFGPSIFDEIRRVAPGPNGEIYLTEAIRALIRSDHPVRAVRLRGDERRHDIGNHRAYFRTFIDYALDDPEWGADVRQYMKDKLAGGGTGS